MCREKAMGVEFSVFCVGDSRFGLFTLLSWVHIVDRPRWLCLLSFKI